MNVNMKRAAATTFALCISLLLLGNILSDYVLLEKFMPAMRRIDDGLPLLEQRRGMDFWLGISTIFTLLKGGVVVWSLCLFEKLNTEATSPASVMVAATTVGLALVLGEIAFGSTSLLLADIIFLVIAVLLWRIASPLSNALRNWVLRAED